MEARSRNDYCRGKAVSSTYSECASVGACAVLYCHLWLVWLYHIFPHCLINGKTFGKTLLNIKCMFRFSLPHLSEEVLILRRIQRDMIFHKNPSGGSRVAPCGQTDGWTDSNDEAQSRFKQFCERA